MPYYDEGPHQVPLTVGVEYVRLSLSMSFGLHLIRLGFYNPMVTNPFPGRTPVASRANVSHDVAVTCLNGISARNPAA